jgi:hypothetical protein
LREKHRTGPTRTSRKSEIRNPKQILNSNNFQISKEIKNQLVGILNFGHCDLPFDLAQGGESFDFAQDREPVERLVEPFDICDL